MLSLLCCVVVFSIAVVWSLVGKGLGCWLFACEYVTVLGQVWYLVVSIPDLTFNIIHLRAHYCLVVIFPNLIFNIA